MGGAVEIEFAVNLAPDRPMRASLTDRSWGTPPTRPATATAGPAPPELVLLQMRPFGAPPRWPLMCRKTNMTL